MITKLSLAALTVLLLAAPAVAQDAWAPWATDEATPAPQVRVVAQVQRVAAQTPRVQTATPARLFNFSRFWVVGSFR